MDPAPDRPRARALDALNFFTANLQTAFGPFVSVYLTQRLWTQSEIGFVLSVGAAAGMASQIPAGALVDAMRRKTVAAGAAILAIIAGAVVLALAPARLPVLLAELLHGFASCMLTPAIAAISLGLAASHPAALGERLGRNARFAAIGNGVAAGLMGLVGRFVGARAVFLLGAALAVPGLAALRWLGGLGAGEARPAPGQGRAPVWPLLRDRRLVVFLLACFLFHLANAAMLPLAAAVVTERLGATAELVIAGCIVAPQIIVALLSPAVGRAAERHGRRIVLLLGFAALPLRGLLLALLPDPRLLIPIQLLDGVSGAAFGVLLPLIAADITRGTGRFNLCLGTLGLACGAGATLSTSLGGTIADHSQLGAFLTLATIGALATLAASLLPETRTGVGPEARPGALPLDPASCEARSRVTG